MGKASRWQKQINIEDQTSFCLLTLECPQVLFMTLKALMITGCGLYLSLTLTCREFTQLIASLIRAITFNLEQEQSRVHVRLDSCARRWWSRTRDQIKRSGDFINIWWSTRLESLRGNETHFPFKPEESNVRHFFPEPKSQHSVEPGGLTHGFRRPLPCSRLHKVPTKEMKKLFITKMHFLISKCSARTAESNIQEKVEEK